MKYFFLMIALGLKVLSTAQTSFNYEIKGEIKGLDNDTLILSTISEAGSNKPQQIFLIGDKDKISYKGQANKPTIIWAQIGAKRKDFGNFTFFIEKGKIEIEGSTELITHTKVTGTVSNNSYSYGNARMNDYYDRMAAPRKKLKEIGDTSSAEYKKIYEKISALYDSINIFQNEFIIKNPNSLGSGIFLLLIADKTPVQLLEEMYNNLGEEVKQLSILSKIQSRIEAKKRSVIGSVAPIFTMTDVNGNNIALENYKGKYVLLDFWASWCVPCREDNPYVKAAYEKFKDKNFVIIGVSIDENGEKWKQAIEKDQLPWLHISDLRKPNKVADLYGVQPIPDNFLIDPNGKIIDRGLHGKAIEKKLETLLK